MDYNDYPILNSTQYEIIKDHYASFNFPNKKEILNNIITLLSDLTYNHINKNDYNIKILQCLDKLEKIFIKQQSNLLSIFNLHTPKIQTCNFNFFSFIKKINNLILLFFSWQIIEDKMYYKSIAEKSIKEILSLLSELYSVLESSNVHFFKHM